jgi:osmotically inducible lipoprotein OsmB
MAVRQIDRDATFLWETARMKHATAVALVAIIALAACTDMSASQQRTLSAGTVGAAGGAVLGAIGGNAALGAVAGAGAGLIGGYVANRYEQSQDAAYQQGYDSGRQSAGR